MIAIQCDRCWRVRDSLEIWYAGHKKDEFYCPKCWVEKEKEGMNK